MIQDSNQSSEGGDAGRALRDNSFALLLRQAAAIAFLLLIAGYLIFNRSFASLGFPPLYIGEMVLGLALIAALFDFKSVFIEPLRRSRAMRWIALFLIYGTVRAAIDSPQKGLGAARDSVICLYAVAVFLAPWLLASLASICSDYRALFMRFLFPAASAGFGYAYLVAHNWIHPFADVKVDFLSLSTAVAVCVYFKFVYFYRPERKFEFKTLAAVARYLLFFCSVSLLLNALPTRTLWPAVLIPAIITPWLDGVFRTRLLATICVVLACVLLTGVVVSQSLVLREKIVALADPDEHDFHTRQGQIAAHSVKWRLVFWKKCIEETGGHAPVFGLGFGSNLTDLLRGSPEWPMFEDSQNAAKYGSPNRNPHSAHVTVFARLGTVGLILWIGLLLKTFLQGVQNCKAQRKRYRFGPLDRFEDERAIFGIETTFLSIWGVYLLAMSFGVVLENPFGGIWFWTLTGVISNRRSAG